MKWNIVFVATTGITMEISTMMVFVSIAGVMITHIASNAKTAAETMMLTAMVFVKNAVLLFTATLSSTLNYL